MYYTVIILLATYKYYTWDSIWPKEKYITKIFIELPLLVESMHIKIVFMM